MRVVSCRLCLPWRSTYPGSLIMGLGIEEYMTTDGQRDSLTSALARARIPAANHAFIQAMVAAGGLTQFCAIDASEPYVLATGSEIIPDVRIFWGYTTGFASLEQASSVAGERPVSGKGAWFVAHPTNRVRRE